PAEEGPLSLAAPLTQVRGRPTTRLHPPRILSLEPGALITRPPDRCECIVPGRAEEKMSGSLVRVLQSLPRDMLIRDRTPQTWRVGELIDSLQKESGPLDPHIYVLHRRSDGRCVITRIEADGGMAKTASYLEVRA